MIQQQVAVTSIYKIQAFLMNESTKVKVLHLFIRVFLF